MPREFSRTQRVADQIQREVAELLKRDVQDPRLEAVTVAAVRVSRDLAHAKVYVTFLDLDESQIESHMRALAHAAGFLRRRLASRVKTRGVPRLHFVHDVSVSRGSRLSTLIEEAVQEDRRRDSNDSREERE